MINADSLKGDLAIELDADSIPAGDFQAALDAFLTLVRELTRQINSHVPRDSWLLNVQTGSQVVSVRADAQRLSATVAAEVYATLFDGIDALEREAKAPRYFTESALEAAKELSRVATARDNGLPVRILSKERSRALTRATFIHVSEILDWAYEDLGTVDGTLEVVSAHNGYEFRIFSLFGLALFAVRLMKNCCQTH